MVSVHTIWYEEKGSELLFKKNSFQNEVKGVEGVEGVEGVMQSVILDVQL
jgi:hypothetical protein